MTTPSSNLPPSTEPHKALPPLPSLPPVRPAPPIVRQVETEYLRRLVASIGLSILLNLLLLALVSSTGLSQLVRLSERPKPPAQRETPKLVLMPKPQPPLLPEPDFPKPRTFLETDPNQMSLEKPKNAEFYSERNTLAAQPTPSPVKSGEIPKADGQNTKSMATETVRPGPRNPPSPPPSPAVPSAATPTPPAPKAVPAQPASPPTPPPQPAPLVPLPPVTKEGDFVFLRRETPPKPQPRTEATPGQKPTEPSPPQAAPSPRSPSPPSVPSVPTTEREVLAAKSKLDGGVGRTGRALAFNSEESPFASYDKKVIAKIGANWNFLIENRFYGETVGRVTISFKLLSSGRVSEVRIDDNSANAVLAGYCVQAIEKSAPFGLFPDALRAIVGDSRDATITFNY